jgi:hypothetical protein
MERLQQTIRRSVAHIFFHILQRLLSKLYEFCTFSSLEVKLCKVGIVIFGRDKRKLNQEAFYLDTNQLDITCEYKQ